MHRVWSIHNPGLGSSLWLFTVDRQTSTCFMSIEMKYLLLYLLFFLSPYRAHIDHVLRSFPN